MNKCSSCGAEMVEGAKFCIICGATVKKEDQIPKVEKEKQKDSGLEGDTEICSSCKASLRKGAKFCVSCGTPVSDPADQQTVLEDEINKKKEPGEKSTAKEDEPSAVKEEKPVKIPSKKEAKPKKEKEPEKEAAQPAVETSAKVKSGRDDSWEVLSGEHAAREVEELNMLAYGQGVVSKISFKKAPKSANLVVHGKVKCHGCNKISLFTLDCNRGWGGSNDPTICPCERKVEVGEYWSDADNAIFVWASTETEVSNIEDYPLSVSISRVDEV